MIRGCVGGIAPRTSRGGMEGLRQESRVSVRCLELGMFVSRLDRPWLESAFPLQGFVIGSDEELRPLQRICSHVFVDIANGRSPDPRWIELDEARLQPTSPQEEFAQLRKTSWTVSRDLPSELPRAKQAMQTLERGIEEVVDDLKQGRGLDLKK